MLNNILIKICGITSPEAALACFEAGADMIGLVYYPPSPRHVDETKIREILNAVEPFRARGKKAVLVVVDQLPNKIDLRIDLVQSYGKEYSDVSIPKIHVVKERKTFDASLAAFPNGPPAQKGSTPLYCLEMSSGILPGGNGAMWDWSLARPFCARYPTLLAGGITPENVLEAIRLARPYGIDVSSGVESAPGIKDFSKVQCLIKNVRQFATTVQHKKP